MRCKNCGWENPEGSQKCERCSSPLERAAPLFTERQGGYEEKEASPNLRSTIREDASGYSPNYDLRQLAMEQQPSVAVGGQSVCQSCGYMLSPGMNVCPQCGTLKGRQKSAGRERSRLEGREKHCPKCGATVTVGSRFCPTCGQQIRNSGTVNAWDNPQGSEYCSLRPIPWSRENTQYNAISFSGERIVLNRANTDPNNQSITSKEQAVLTNDGKDWYIEDLSEQHSTMIRVSRKMKLQSGDIIALGNRLFEFMD